MNQASQRRIAASTLPLVRCAIYTRKSTEEGFGAGVQQPRRLRRESVEAFIRSQAAEGWTRLPDRHDDGGLHRRQHADRPAPKRLMADVEAGKIDCLVTARSIA